MGIKEIVPKVTRVLRQSGVRGLAHAAVHKYKVSVSRRKQLTWNSLVREGDAKSINFDHGYQWQLQKKRVISKSPHLIWIMSPPGASSGGHQNLFRFISFAENSGFRCSIFLYSNAIIKPNLGSVEHMLRETSAYPHVNAELHHYEDEGSIPADADAIFATGWETAYPAALAKSDARRLYLVQDFEPWFYPVGSESTLALQTYNLGFTAITAGKWLQRVLSLEHGMEALHFDFGVDSSLYYRFKMSKRNGVFFYARPVTPRRGYELGILVLQEFARRNPTVDIHIAGWEIESSDLPFKHISHGALDIAELNAVYNECGAGLVLSLTNLSLLPLELLAAGVLPVINDGPNNREVESNKFFYFAKPNVSSLVNALERALGDSNNLINWAEAEALLKEKNWENSGRQFVTSLREALDG